MLNFTWKSWLPDGVLAGGRVEPLLSETIGQWSDKWLARSAVRPLGPLVPDTGLQDAHWRVLELGLALAIRRDADLKLAGLMLNEPLDAGALTGPDRQVLDQLSTGCIEDLCARLSRLFRLPADARWRSGDTRPHDSEAALACSFGTDEARPLIELFVQPELATALVKASLPPAPASAPVQPIAAGLAKQPVSLSALLGRCELTIADLAGLGEGDVLVLDREVDAALELAVDGEVKPGRCVVEQDGNSLALKILEPMSG